ncbi:SAICAR synthase-like protein [Daedalea quercina L-15889]|uniref:1-phosphatidylinositol-4-phosphate 5-kinase n=1 Tax=Daedalea quercina L-15889 TaxID=1314783 RepID=A0A165MXT6_9APHY|nr:SAICAR synthase-like protein [Daedalea quercina L-15889]
MPPAVAATKSEPIPSLPVTFEDPAREPRQSTSARNSPSIPFTRPQTRSSTDTKGSLSITTSQGTPFPASPPSPTRAHTSADGFLQAPPLTPLSHKRRNTTGSGSLSSLNAALPTRTKTIHTPNPAHAYSNSYSQSHVYDAEDIAATEGLESEMQQQAERIRRERQSKRQAEKAKAQPQAEGMLTRTMSIVRGQSSRGGDDAPLVGNLIGEEHVNYVLMYNMLTGIRTSVSRCQAKIRRPLAQDDYTAANKYSFDIVGNELTPSAKYDFKFKDYAPWVFRELREDFFLLDPADYLVSLTSKYILSELGSPGKSGSFFYFSRDYRFIIKTIHHNEHKFLRQILPLYYDHVKTNPHTLLSRFYGLHRVKLPRGRKIHFVIMNNLFPPHRDIHETYDLKGSTVGREYPEEKARENPRATLKDLNWIHRDKTLELGPEKRALLTEQLRRDSEFLKQLGVMDYSLLVGVHNMRRGNKDNVRSNTLKVFSPHVPVIRRKPTHVKGPGSPDAVAMRRIMRESDPKRLGSATLRLPEEDTTVERQHFLFYQNEGGLRATDEQNDNMDLIYYLGVIDILTPYNTKKKVEHFWKGLSADKHKISPVPPREYGDRFFSFMKAIMRGGEGGAKFLSKSEKVE